MTLRKFKISSINRSKRTKQLVIPVYFSAVKEISLKQVRLKSKRVNRKKLLSNVQPKFHLAAPFILIILGIGGTLFFTIHTQQGKQLEPAKTFAVPAKVKAKPVKKEDNFLPKSLPTHINIASVGIDYDVISVGQDANGSIEMPPLFNKVTGWYNASPTPGEKGPAIIVGHVDTYQGISVFWRLREVQPGDMIEVARADGKTARFKVDALKQFQQSNFPTAEVYGNIDHAGLRLITCGGAFDSGTAQYTENTVVFASLVK